MNHIQKTSNVLLAIFNILLIVTPLITCCLWLLVDTNFVKTLISQGLFVGPITTPEGTIDLSQMNWTIVSKVIALIANFIQLLPFFFSIISLKIIFENYKKAAIFTITNAKHYRRLGLLFFLDALIAKPLGGMLMVLSVTLSNPPGHRYITISFGSPSLEAIFYGIIILVISWVMLEATKLNEENRFTV
ncbi:MAG: DUF2975 domain-containing protein [Alphaproteobacteria bacterium]